MLLSPKKSTLEPRSWDELKGFFSLLFLTREILKFSYKFYWRSPAELLVEVILVDDASTKENLGKLLGQSIRFNADPDPFGSKSLPLCVFLRLRIHKTGSILVLEQLLCITEF